MCITLCFVMSCYVPLSTHPGKTSESNLICYFVRREPLVSASSGSIDGSSATDTSTPAEHVLTPREQAFERLYAAFIQGSDEFRNSRFKIIPRIAEVSGCARMRVTSDGMQNGSVHVCECFTLLAATGCSCTSMPCARL